MTDTSAQAGLLWARRSGEDLKGRSLRQQGRQSGANGVTSGPRCPPASHWEWASARTFTEAVANFPADVPKLLEKGLQFLENATGLKYGDRRRPLLVSVRSGAPDLDARAHGDPAQRGLEPADVGRTHLHDREPALRLGFLPAAHPEHGADRLLP